MERISFRLNSGYRILLLLLLLLVLLLLLLLIRSALVMLLVIESKMVFASVCSDPETGTGAVVFVGPDAAPAVDIVAAAVDHKGGFLKMPAEGVGFCGVL